jgi:hypothetical protein
MNAEELKNLPLLNTEISKWTELWFVFGENVRRCITNRSCKGILRTSSHHLGRVGTGVEVARFLIQYPWKSPISPLTCTLGEIR